MSRSARLAIALVLLAAPAGAVDLSGTWNGSYTCTGSNGEVVKVKQKESVLLIAQTDATFSASIDGTAYNGAVLNLDADATKKGDAVMNSCTLDAVPMNGASGEIVHFKVKVDPDKGSGTVSGESIFESVSQQLVCKLKYKRTNTTPTKFTGCPV